MDKFSDIYFYFNMLRVFKDFSRSFDCHKDDGVSRSDSQQANPLSHCPSGSPLVTAPARQPVIWLGQAANQSVRKPANQTAGQLVLLFIHSSAAGPQLASSHPATHPAGEPANLSVNQSVG